MIESIFIQNFGIVEETSFTPQSGFNVITGETGAGKSMIVGAISLLLGNRSSGILIPDPNRKAVLEMTVSIDEITVNEVFNKYDIDFSNPLVIRREISPNGRSRSFINDSLVPLTALSELSSKIVDLSEQHENLSLNKADMRLQMIDDFAQNENFREEYLLKFNVYQQLKLKRNQIEKLLKNAKTDFDFVQFQLSELIELNYQMGEQSELEQELELLLHAEEIKNALFQAVQIIDSDSTGLLDRLNEVVNALRQASKHYQNSVEIVSRFENIRIDVKELLNDIERDFEKIEVDPQRLIVVENRLSSIYRLVAKHQLVKGDDL
ncbi:MAG: AAA family ATPase, partial [Bacteroidales bacterium]|nr:AAA family ATPase [Bacteroidales bacterium]